MNLINYLNHIFTSSAYAVTPDSIVGTLNPPTGIPIATSNTKSFISTIIVLLTVVAGIYALWQFLSGGLDYITSAGDKNKVAQAGQKITNALIGLALIAGSFIIIAVISFVLFGKADFILNPQIIPIGP